MNSCLQNKAGRINEGSEPRVQNSAGQVGWSSAGDPRWQRPGDNGETGVGTVAKLEHRAGPRVWHQASSNRVLPCSKTSLRGHVFQFLKSH